MWISLSYGCCLNMALNMITLRNGQKSGPIIMVYIEDNLFFITLDFCFATLTEECPKSSGSWLLWSLSNTVTGWIQVVGFCFGFFPSIFSIMMSCFLAVLSTVHFFNRDLHVDMLVALIKCFYNLDSTPK